MMTEAAQLKHFDIIEGLHIRYMKIILEAIFKFLDSESLRNAELTCKTWKAAVSDINPNKLWQMLLHKKISTSPLWKSLHYCLKSKLPSKDCLSSRNLFSKIEFTAKALQNNWMKNDSTREYVDCHIGLQNCVFQMCNKFIALWEPISGIFKIWNRITLKVEEVYNGPPHQPDLDYELYEDALIYSMKDYIFIRNLTTKTTKVHKPFGSENKKWINFLRVDNGILCVAAGVEVIASGLVASLFIASRQLSSKKSYVWRQGNDRNDVLIWKMKSPTEIEWKNPKIVPSVSMDNTRIYMDDKFIITAHYGTSYIFCDVYLMSSPQRKQKCLKIPKTRAELLYQDGFFLTVTVLDEIKIVDVETGKSKIIANIGADFSRQNNFLEIHSGYIIACTFVGCSHFGSRIQILDFKKATEPTTKLPLKPFCSHHVFMEPAMILHVDAFGILAVNRELEFLNARDIIWTLNFLPICSFCKRVKKRLLKCASCKSAKYCSSICQKADWNHHRDLCRKIRDY